MRQRKGHPAERVVRASAASMLTLTQEACTMTASKRSLREEVCERLALRGVPAGEVLVRKEMIVDSA